MYALSPYILIILISWFSAQGLKYVVFSLKHRNFKKGFGQLYLSGDMPSAHSATVVSLLVLIGVRQGFDSAIFGLAALFSAIVMYDAMMVRRSSGEQGRALTQLLVSTKSDIRLPRVAKGHTPSEVAAGALLGLIISIIVILATS